MSKYRILKHLCVALQTINIPIGVASGVMLATGKALLFASGVTIMMVLAFIQGHIWWLTMEKLKGEE